jgi:hypothetical protein
MTEDRPTLAWFVTILDRLEDELAAIEEHLRPLPMTYEKAEEILAASSMVGISLGQLRHGLNQAFRV